MIQPRRTRRKSTDEVAKEWDALAERRHEQIAQGLDYSFEVILAPLILDLLEQTNRRYVLDVGCGTGDLTAIVAPTCGRVIALDPSQASLSLARRSLASDVTFYLGALEKLAHQLGPIPTVLAGMTLMSAPNLEDFVSALSSVVPPGGHFVATMTHPWFWPRYWEYENESWFRYDTEIFVEASFRIAADETDTRTTHVHRPLEAYFRALEQNNFVLETLREPMPPHNNPPSIPWAFPRFLGFRWRRVD